MAVPATIFLATAFLDHTLPAGHFQGTLPELARHINASLAGADSGLLSAGEMLAEDPAVALEMAPGTTVLDALVAFARASGRGWNLTLRNLELPGAAENARWSGAYLTPLSEWGPSGPTPLNP